MRKYFLGLVVALAICASTTMGAAAQTYMVKTADGAVYNDNPNLHFVDADLFHVELQWRGLVSFGSYTAYGSELLWRRVYTPSAVGFSYGIKFGSEYSSEFGMASSAQLLAGITFGDRLRFGVDAFVGYAQKHNVISSADAEEITFHKSSKVLWRPQVGAEINLSFDVSESVTLSAFFGGSHAFMSKGTYVPEDGWHTMSTYSDSDRLYGGLGLGLRLDPTIQRSGDNCWVGEVYGGYSSRGAIAGLKAIHFKRFAYNWARTLGMGSEYTFGDYVTNEVFGQAGLALLPMGAYSPIVLNAFVTAGFTQLPKSVQGAAEDVTRLHTWSRYLSPAFAGKGHFGVSYHAGRLEIGAEGYYGIIYGLFGTTFVNPDPERNINYHQTGDSERFAPVYGANIKLAFNF